MPVHRITLTGVRVQGPGAPEATVDFKSGLNVIAGASDTGKTFVGGTIDFLLGASSPPPDNPFSRAYNRAMLGLSSGGAQYTISRDFRENVAQLHSTSLDLAAAETANRQLSAAHRTGSTDSLSYFLLSLLGLEGKLLRRNQYGEKSSLTMRHIAHLTVISEERIISRNSPALSGDIINAPLERAIFSFFLTGIDDADLTAIEKPKDRKARLDTEDSVLRSILETKDIAYGKLMGNDVDPDERLRKIDAAIAEATQFVTATQEEIQALETQRESSWEQLQKGRSRILFVGEQLKRLRLLQDFYETDRERLEAVLEAGKTFEQLPGGGCAVCGSTPNPETAPAPIGEFKAACIRELAKLGELSTELKKATSEMVEEETTLRRDAETLERSLAMIDGELQSKLKPQSTRANTGLMELIRLKSDIAKAVDLKVEVSNLNQRLRDIEASRKAKLAKTASTSIGTAKAARFCEAVQETLVAWKYPLNGNVSFDADPKRFDLVIGDQDRGSMGKGYRAITHAAFVIGLMRYCRREQIPHPGFVILDTPLNPFKGPDDGPSGKVNDEIKDAFFDDLANDSSGDQFIILENTEPPKRLLSSIHYHHFSKNPAVGRYGFFPVGAAPN